MDNLSRIIAEHPFFAGLEEPQLKLLAGCASNERYKVGDFLFHEGQEARRFFILREGLVAIEIQVSGDGPVTLYTHDAGDIIGWSWLFAPYHWHFSARVVQPARVIALDGVCLRGKCETDHELGYEFLKRFSAKMSYTLDMTRMQLLDMFKFEA